MSDDFEKILGPQGEAIRLHDGSLVELGDLKVRLFQIKKIKKVIQPLWPNLKDLYKNGSLDVPNLLALIGDHTDDIADLLAEFTGRPKEVIENQDIAVVADLFLAVITVNIDFFMQSLLPSLSKAMAVLGGSLGGQGKTQPGQTPSSS